MGKKNTVSMRYFLSVQTGAGVYYAYSGSEDNFTENY